MGQVHVYHCPKVVNMPKVFLVQLMCPKHEHYGVSPLIPLITIVKKHDLSS